MLSIAKAELKYNAASLVAWFGILIAASLWPLIEASSAGAIATSMALLAIYLPFAAPIGALRVLSAARNEGRPRLLRTLPLPTWKITAGRIASTQAIPLLAVLLAAALIAVGMLREGAGFLDRFRGAWVLPTMLLVSIAVCLLAVMLCDLFGLQVAQLGLAAIGLVVLLCALNPSLKATVLDPISAFAESPQGFLASIGLVSLLFVIELLIASR